jgi:hypothetical protein
VAPIICDGGDNKIAQTLGESRRTGDKREEGNSTTEQSFMGDGIEDVDEEYPKTWKGVPLGSR